MKKVTLSNGIRLLWQRKASARAVTISVFVGVGSRHETLDSHGFAHFIEHMVFKGTQKRSALDIANEADMIGGQLNAYTTKEYTCYYIRVLPEFLADAVDILSDIVINPEMRKKDFELERGVILEEIDMYNDDPEDLAADTIYAAAWGDNPLGRSITGTPESVSATTRDGLFAFYKRFYCPENIVVSVSGCFDEQEMCALTERYFSALKSVGYDAPGFEKPAYQSGKVIKIEKESSQLQFCLAFPCGGLEKKNGAELSVLSTIAGSGASSMLFQRLREELGLVYSVYTYMTAHKGCGVFVVSGGVSPKNMPTAKREIEQIIFGIEANITAKQLERAKNQSRSALAMSYESSYNLAMDMGRRELLGLAHKTERQHMKRLENVSLEGVAKAAAIFNPSDMTECYVGGKFNNK